MSNGRYMNNKMYDWGELDHLSSEEDSVVQELDYLKKKKNIRMIVISGPSHSGKTTLSRNLSNHFTAQNVQNRVVSQDRFFRKDVRAKLQGDYDQPKAIDHMRLRQKLIDELKNIPKDSVLILEGFMTYFDLFIPSISDFNLWINAQDPDELAKRREKTGQNFLGIKWYHDTVWANHLEYVKYCDKLFTDHSELHQRIFLTGDEQKMTDNAVNAIFSN